MIVLPSKQLRLSGQLEAGVVEDGTSQPLLVSLGEKQCDEDREEEEECDASEEAPEEIHKPVTSIVAAYRLLTPSVKVYV